MSTLSCPLCGGTSTEVVEDRRRTYYLCRQCDLVFADPASHLHRAAEKRVYDQHENYPADPQYRRFLGQLFQPLVPRLTPGMQGLDFGCGPGPTLSVMFQEAGLDMDVYDPFYAPDTAVLQREYDFVTCTEVVEHFCRPSQGWSRLVSLLRTGGWLGVMTRLRPATKDFKQWYYKNDPTHVSFYSRATVEWLARHYGMTIEHLDHNVVLFLKTQT